MEHDPLAELPPELKQNMTRYKAPPGLQRRIRYMLAQQQPRGGSLIARASAAWRRWLPMGASFACGALLAVTVLTYRQADTRDGVGEEAVTSHVRSLMAGHLMDVASTDQHTVKPWFSGKLDYAPPVIDLASDGFPLIGGRLDYLQGRPVAALVYRRGGHMINVFVQPGPDTAASTTRSVRQGYQVARWHQAGMSYWAVSDLSPEEMRKFAGAFQSAQ